MSKKIKQFNIVIVGTGGQGLMTVLQVLAEAALSQDYDVKTSELHGLSQRGGSVKAHIRFGKKIYSPIVPLGKADLVLALEAQESLRALKFGNQKSIFLLNKQIIPIPLQKPIPLEEITATVKEIGKTAELIPAFEICREKLGTGVISGIFLVGLASFKGLLPLPPKSILNAIKKVIPQKYLELNVKTFKLAKAYGK